MLKRLYTSKKEAHMNSLFVSFSNPTSIDDCSAVKVVTRPCNRILGVALQEFRSRIMSPGLWESSRLKELAIPNAWLA